MTQASSRPWRKTLSVGEGFPALSRRVSGYRLRRAALTTTSIVAFVLGAASASAALDGQPASGVMPSSDGARVLSVDPSGFAWAAGVRPGQTIVAFGTALDAGGWWVETTDGVGTYQANAAVALDGLRASLPFAILAIVLGAGGLVFLRTHRRWVVPAACVTILAASVPLEIVGDPQLSAVSVAASVLVPVPWLGWRLRWRVARVLVGLAAIAFVAWWAVARGAASSTYPTLEGARALVATAATVGVLAVYTLVPIIRREPIRMTRPRLFDAGALAAIAGLSLGLVFFAGLSPIVVILAVLAASLALPSLRRFANHGLERALLADVRRQAAEEASEEERARMARELHDAPLQELAAVIRRLDQLPEAHRESEQLRSVASELRAVTTDLRPPVLDDLGLGAAIDFIAEQRAESGPPVRVEIRDRTGIEAARRPPPAVELAVFRIVQEAVANAARHAAAAAISVRGVVEPDRIDLMVRDDGVGLPRDAERAAARLGRLGLASMRRRAQSIDADLSIHGSGQGTTVHLDWQR
jgi:signal transduction histidine kinase